MGFQGSTRARGRAVEEKICRYLVQQGLQIVETNVEYATAELDIVAIDERDGERTYVFVEVRSRADDEHGTPAETVDRAKQRRVIRAATQWLVAAKLWEKVCVRFDVVGVTGPVDGAVIEWIEHAFECA